MLRGSFLIAETAPIILLGRNRLLVACLVKGLRGSYTNHRARVHKEEQLMTPSFRFPLRAGGTEWVRSAVPLAKQGGPYGGGQLMNFEHAIGIISRRSHRQKKTTYFIPAAPWVQYRDWGRIG